MRFEQEATEETEKDGIVILWWIFKVPEDYGFCPNRLLRVGSGG
jgi:hypothetical protein